MIDLSTGDAGKAAFASTNAVNSVEAVTAADAAAASEAAGGATGKATTQESGMVEANQQSTKREEKDDEVVDTSTSASSDEAAEDDGLNSAEGKSIEKTTLLSRSIIQCLQNIVSCFLNMGLMKVLNNFKFILNESK